jgi:hypothetical protein
MLKRADPSPAELRRRRYRGRSILHHRERMRRYRERQAAGDLMVTQRITPAETAKLFRHGYLGEHELEDRTAIAEAITALIADLMDK